MPRRQQSSMYSNISELLPSKLTKTADGKPRKRIRCFTCRLRKDTRRSPYLLKIGCVIQLILEVPQLTLLAILLGFTAAMLYTEGKMVHNIPKLVSFVFAIFICMFPCLSIIVSICGIRLIGEDRRAFGEKKLCTPLSVYISVVLLRLCTLIFHIVLIFLPKALPEVLYASMAYSLVTIVVPIVILITYLLLPKCEEKCCQCALLKDKPMSYKSPPRPPPRRRKEQEKQRPDTDQSNSSVLHEPEKDSKMTSVVEPVPSKKEEEDEGLVTGTEQKTEEEKKKKEPEKEKKESAEVLFSPKEADPVNIEDGYEDFGPGEDEGGTKDVTLYDVDETGGDTGGLPRGTPAASNNVLRKKISNGAAAGVVDKRMKDAVPTVRAVKSGEMRVKKSRGAPGSKDTQVSEDEKKWVKTITVAEKKTPGINRKKSHPDKKKEEAKKPTNVVQRNDQKTQRSEEK